MSNEKKPKYRELEVTANTRLQYASKGSIFKGYYDTPSGLQIIITEDYGNLHISVSHASRYPSWNELRDIKYHFYPDMEFAQYFPPKAEYVNVHPNCFHLWEVKRRE